MKLFEDFFLIGSVVLGGEAILETKLGRLKIQVTNPMDLLPHVDRVGDATVFIDSDTRLVFPKAPLAQLTMSRLYESPDFFGNHYERSNYENAVLFIGDEMGRGILWAKTGANIPNHASLISGARKGKLKEGVDYHIIGEVSLHDITPYRSGAILPKGNPEPDATYISFWTKSAEIALKRFVDKILREIGARPPFRCDFTSGDDFDSSFALKDWLLESNPASE